MNLYSTLSEAPDPYPLLEATIDSLVNFSEMQNMTKDNSSLHATVSRLSNQISNLEASLSAKNKELERKEAEKEEEAKRVEEVWRGVLDEKTRNWESKEKALSEKLEHQEGVLKEMKASYEVAQKMGTMGGDGEDFLGKERSAELEIVTRDLERTTLRLAEVEGRNEELRLKFEQAATENAGQNSQPQTLPEDDPAILRLQSENGSLLRRIDSTKGDLETTRREHERKIRTLTRQLQDLEKDKETLKAKVSRTSDYEDVRRELEILKSIEFSTGDDDEDEDEETALNLLSASPTTTRQKESLEQLLLARNKKLSNELTVLRVSHQDLSNRIQSLQSTLTATTSDLQTSKSLNRRLEDDLLKLQNQTPSHGPALSVAGTYMSRHPSSNKRISPASSIISGLTPQREDYLAAPPQNSSMLNILTEQRNRFHKRNTELEAELSILNSTVSSLRSEIQSLHKVNLELYEKTRYVSSYRGGGASSGASSSTNGAGTDRYRAAYEQNISPFEAFRGRESKSAYRRMRWFERITYSFTRIILANRVSRNLFALYCVALHVLVFYAVFWMGNNEVRKGAVAAMGEGMAAASAMDGASAAQQEGTEWRKEDFDERL